MYADNDVLPHIPFLNTRLYSLCLVKYDRMVEVVQAMDRLIVGLMHFYTLLTGKEMAYGRLSLRDVQPAFTFGTPARDGFEHQDNCELNRWHAMFGGKDDE